MERQEPQGIHQHRTIVRFAPPPDSTNGLVIGGLADLVCSGYHAIVQGYRFTLPTSSLVDVDASIFVNRQRGDISTHMLATPPPGVRQELAERVVVNFFSVVRRRALGEIEEFEVCLDWTAPTREPSQNWEAKTQRRDEELGLLNSRLCRLEPNSAGHGSGRLLSGQ